LKEKDRDAERKLTDLERIEARFIDAAVSATEMLSRKIVKVKRPHCHDQVNPALFPSLEYQDLSL
jgi:hypothetical protein